MTDTSYTDLPEVTDGMLQAALQTTRPFTVVILRTGPNYEAPDPGFTSDVAKIIWAHGKRNYALHLAGLLPVVCPIGDGTGVAGVGIFDAGPEDVERILAHDPAVQADVLRWEIHRTRSFPGSTLCGNDADADRDLEQPA